MERTLVLLKPDCVQRRLIGQVITRFENKGLNIVAMKHLHIFKTLSSSGRSATVTKTCWLPASLARWAVFMIAVN